MSQRDERGACVADLDDAIACRRRATGTGTSADMDIDLPAVTRRMRRIFIRQEKLAEQKSSLASGMYVAPGAPGMNE